MRLSGKAAICQFMGRGWATIEELILKEGFPAKKILGVWESDSDLITEWRQKKIEKEKAAERRGNPNFRKKSAKKTKDIHN